MNHRIRTVLLTTTLLAAGTAGAAAQSQAPAGPTGGPPREPRAQADQAAPARPTGDAATDAPGQPQAQADQAAPANAKPAKVGLTVAVLDFAADTPGSDDLGAQISEVLAASLSGTDGITLVDRSSLARALQEQELNLSGVVSPEQATQVGKLVGARLLVTGKAFAVGKKTFLTAKVIGTETSLVDPVLVTGDKDADVGELAVQLAGKLSVRLREAGPRLVGDDGEIPLDPVPALRERLATRRLPVVSVDVDEQHVTATPGRAIDPAVQTEIRLLLKECGIRVIEGGEPDRAEAGVSLVIGGEAMSEFAARIGNLVSCSGRAEITVKDRKTGEVVFTHRETTRAVDLSEQIAGKTALQRAGRVVGLRLLEHLAETLPAADNGPNPNPAKPEAQPEPKAAPKP